MAEKTLKVRALERLFVPDRGEFGEYVMPGQVVELPEERAKKLAALGAAEFVEAKQPVAKGGEK